MKKRLFSVFYMFVLTLCFTSIVSAVKYFNDERIDTNQRVKLQSIVLRVLNIPVEKNTPDAQLVKIFETRVKSIDVKGQTLYVGYEEDGQTILGYAFPVGGPGFWGPVYGMAAVDPKATRILGIAFYKHSETPGLGGRISEKWFSDQFKDLPLYPMNGDKRIFYLKSVGPEKAPNELDAVTGATGTSRAVESFLNQELQRFLKEFRESMTKG